MKNYLNKKCNKTNLPRNSFEYNKKSHGGLKKAILIQEDDSWEDPLNKKEFSTKTKCEPRMCGHSRCIPRLKIVSDFKLWKVGVKSKSCQENNLEIIQNHNSKSTIPNNFDQNQVKKFFEKPDYYQY